MAFSTPLALILLFTIPYFVWLARPRAQRRRWRDWLSLGLRLLIVILLVLSLAGAQAVRAADELAVVFLVDGSDSIGAAQAEQAEAFVRAAIGGMGPNDAAAVVVFGANALVERPLSSLTELAPVTSLPQGLQTNLEEAVRLGMALFPAGSARRMVVLTDGAVTAGSTQGAADLAAAAGVPLDFVYLARPPLADEAALLDVRAPTRVNQGETFRLDITAESSRDMPAELRVLAGGRLAYQETVQLRTGLNNFAVRLQTAAQEFARYRVQLTPVEDTYFQNNELSAYTEVVGPPRVLLVAHDGTPDEDGAPRPDESQQLRLALEATGLQIDRVTPAELPTTLPALSDYASVVLVDVNARELSPRKMETLQSYVRDLGGGLVVVGGPESYGMGGYYATPLEAALPVDMQITDEERFPSVSIALVIDRSGSMTQEEGGLSKIQLASEGAVRVVQLLKNFDEITVIPVDTVPSGAFGPLPTDDRQAIIDQIREIGAGGGGIYVRTGLEAAAEALERSEKQVKHIILLADGGDAEEKDGVPQLIESLRSQGITVSTVSIGRGPDTAWLQQMAELGNGRFHFTDQAANLPQIFTQETTSIQRNYLIEERFFPSQVNPSPILSGIRVVPALQGYVGTSPKDTAQVVLVTHQGDPLLATWQYGLGRTVAWMSDATGRWATEWVRWEGFPVFWSQAVRWTITEGRNSTVETAVDFSDTQAQLSVDARDGSGSFLNDLDLTANVVDSAGQVQTVTLQQMAPGRYAASFEPQTEGAYLIRLAGEGQDGATAVAQTAGWVLGYSPEYRDLSPNPRLLTTLAERSGGRDLIGLAAGDAAAEVFAHDLPSRPTTRPIWPWLTLLAVLLLPLDIAARRVVVTRRDLARAWAATFGRVLPAVEPAPTRPQQVERLFAAKQRAGKQSQPPPETTVPPPIQRADQTAQATQAETREERPLPPETPPEGSLAARLLAKKRDKSE